MTSDERVRQAILLFDGGQYAEAAEQAWQGLQASADDGQLWQLYGAARGALRDHRAAREALERACALVPLHPPAWYALAEAYFHLGQTELACVGYEYLGASTTKVGLLTAVAARLGRLQKYRSALKVCGRITDLDPAHHQAFFGMAFFMGRLGAPPQDLISPLALAMDLAPQVLHYRLNLAFVWAEVGGVDRAAALLETVAPEEVRCPCWLRRMAGVFEAAGDEERSQACLRRLPDSPERGTR